MLLRGQGVHRAHRRDPALEPGDLALGALGGGGVQLRRVIVDLVADLFGLLGETHLGDLDVAAGGVDLVLGASDRHPDLPALRLQGVERALHLPQRPRARG